MVSTGAGRSEASRSLVATCERSSDCGCSFSSPEANKGFEFVLGAGQTAAGEGQTGAERSRSALVMTETLLRLIAAAAIIGFSSHASPRTGTSTPAATGIPSVL